MSEVKNQVIALVTGTALKDMLVPAPDIVTIDQAGQVAEFKTTAPVQVTGWIEANDPRMDALEEEPTPAAFSSEWKDEVARVFATLPTPDYSDVPKGTKTVGFTDQMPAADVLITATPTGPRPLSQQKIGRALRDPDQKKAEFPFKFGHFDYSRFELAILAEYEADKLNISINAYEYIKALEERITALEAKLNG